MDKKKLTQLAETFTRSCEKLVKDQRVTKVIFSPANLAVTMTVIYLFSDQEIKARWG